MLKVFMCMRTCVWFLCDVHVSALHVMCMVCCVCHVRVCVCDACVFLFSQSWTSLLSLLWFRVLSKISRCVISRRALRFAWVSASTQWGVRWATWLGSPLKASTALRSPSLERGICPEGTPLWPIQCSPETDEWPACQLGHTSEFHLDKAHLFYFLSEFLIRLKRKRFYLTGSLVNMEMASWPLAVLTCEWESVYLWKDTFWFWERTPGFPLVGAHPPEGCPQEPPSLSSALYSMASSTW